MNRNKQKSKFLSLILRHRPEVIGITLDKNGWANVDELLKGTQTGQHLSITFEELEEIVATNEKKRFIFSEDKKRIRANQGHTIKVELDYETQIPPNTLYHGTVKKFIASIKQDGLLKMERHHVHLSPDKETAIQVGGRRGKPIILLIDSGQMYKDGFVFYRTPNNVWLVDHVPSRYVSQ